MCLIIPGKIKKINSRDFVVAYGNHETKVKNSLVGVEAGDYVIVQNNFIIKKLNSEQAEKILKLCK